MDEIDANETVKRRSQFRDWVSVARSIAAWVALAAVANFLMVTLVIFYKYPYAYYVPSPPAAPRWMISWRNWSFVLGLVTSLISLPKWQSLIALPLVLLLTFFNIITAD